MPTRPHHHIKKEEEEFKREDCNEAEFNDNGPKKRKKKEPPFPTPDWAEELNSVIDKVKEMEKLSSDKINLKLDDSFIQDVNTQLQRFKKEIAYRKFLEDEARREAEEKALKKAKKKK